VRNKIFGTAAVLVAGVALTACGSSKALPANVQTQNANADTATTVPAATSATPVATVVLKVANDPTLGPIVQDGNGNTLYAFTNDTDGKSNCNDACATTWPPSRVTDAAMNVDGIDQSLLSTITRADGTTQLALNKWPLYRFAADGDGTGTTKGQGSKGVWFVLGPDGKLRKTGQANGTVATTTTAPTTTTAAPAPVAPTLGGTGASASTLASPLVTVEQLQGTNGNDDNRGNGRGHFKNQRHDNGRHRGRSGDFFLFR
jgi:predicted lipoprotein with Yx(FWY)xxD motif